MKKVSGKNLRTAAIRNHMVPLLVWIAALAGVVGLFQRRSNQFEILGLAEGQAHNVQATSVARLKELYVELFQEVTAGQVLAVLDPAIDNDYQQEQIKAEKAVIEAEIKRLQAELQAAKEDLLVKKADQKTDLATTYQQFSVDIQKSRLRILELKTIIEPDLITLQELDLNIKSFIAQTPMEQENAYYELQKLKLQRSSLEKKISENQQLLAQTQQDLTEAQTQRDQIAQLHPANLSLDSALKPVEQAIMVQEKKLQQVLIQRKPIVLKAPVSGMISQLNFVKGEVVLLGNSIMTVAENKPRQIAAWTTEEQANIISKDLKVQIVKKSQPPQIAPGQVIYIGPTLEMVPQRLWTNLDMPQWGRRILISVDAEMKMIPGEIVGVRGL